MRNSSPPDISDRCDMYDCLLSLKVVEGRVSASAELLLANVVNCFNIV